MMNDKTKKETMKFFRDMKNEIQLKNLKLNELDDRIKTIMKTDEFKNKISNLSIAKNEKITVLEAKEIFINTINELEPYRNYSVRERMIEMDDKTLCYEILTVIRVQYSSLYYFMQ